MAPDDAAKVGRVKRRVFIAIDLPPELKQRVAETITQWQWLPIRWLNRENWHITLIPPAYLEDSEVELLVATLAKSRRSQPFAMRFSRVILAPPGSPARMIWLEGDTPAELAALKKKIEKLFRSQPALPRLKIDSRPPHLHVTLARFEPGELAELEQKTRVLGEVDFRFAAKELAVMESHLKPTGAEYEKVAAIPL